jgi:hypothetical protein
MNMDPRDGEREVEQWLDAALGQYGKVEPRTGLESRVLANLQSERNRIAPKRRRWWAVGTVAVAVAIVAAVWFGEGSIPRIPPRTMETSTVTHRDNARVSRPSIHPSQVDRRPQEPPPPRLAKRPNHDFAPVKAPKLEQFPSPSPMNEQEKMLARYVQEFPQRAALVARAQTELQKRDEREMAAPWPKNAESTSSDQQE